MVELASSVVAFRLAARRMEGEFSGLRGRSDDSGTVSDGFLSHNEIRNCCLYNHGTLTHFPLAEALCDVYGEVSHEIVAYKIQNYLVLLPVALRVATAPALKGCLVSRRTAGVAKTPT
jgi:hypothetical protein